MTENEQTQAPEFNPQPGPQAEFMKAGEEANIPTPVDPQELDAAADTTIAAIVAVDPQADSSHADGKVAKRAEEQPVRLATDEEISAVKTRALQLSHEGTPSGEIAAKIAEETGQSVESIENCLAAQSPVSQHDQKPVEVVMHHQQAAEINVARTADEGYVGVGDQL